MSVCSAEGSVYRIGYNMTNETEPFGFGGHNAVLVVRKYE
jgi:3-oxoacyl-(acyl-carrier-protein) synthase